MQTKKKNIKKIHNIGYWKGKFKGVTKNFLKEHGEDWNDPYRE